ncbi:MAG TPA: GTP-binding protein [Verrucomicrobiae bacterium]
MKLENPQAKKPRFILIGGFLGAGKTTSILQLAQRLGPTAGTLGVITNDEGTQLVDTPQLRTAGFIVEEISGGTFASQMSPFVEAIRRLIDSRCQIIFAECSGTSAELRSKVLDVLAAELGDALEIAPLSVVLDSVRAVRVLRLQSGGGFSEKLAYIYRKQIEEAELLVANKTDLFPAAQLSQLREVIGELAPNATLLDVSNRHATGLDEWLNCLTGKQHTTAHLSALDSGVFADAQALLGWLNCTVNVSSVRYFDGAKLLTDLATAIQSALKQDAVEIAHLKILLRAEDYSEGGEEFAIANLVRSDASPELHGEIREPVQRAELILNLRAETKPDLLHAAVNRALLEIVERSPELFARMEHCEHFRPAAH